MRILIVIGAGASFDSWPKHLASTEHYKKIPLANDLFAALPAQNELLNQYNLMGLARQLRRKIEFLGKNFDIEAELENINKVASNRNDPNTIKSLFITRFYLQHLIKNMAIGTLNHTNSDTVYVDLLNQLKDWIDESPSTRFVDIVSFNYDHLLEKAMETVYSYDWSSKNKNTPLNAYYAGNNLRIFKPHGSINWGREILKNDQHFSYSELNAVFSEFDQIELAHSFQLVDPNIFTDARQKIFIPAIAIPFKQKTNFDECPQEMLAKMLEAVQDADKIMTFGWKGTDEHFTNLLKDNKKIDEVYIISPEADTSLDKVFPLDLFKPFKSTFRYFVSDSPTFENILHEFDKKVES